MGAFFCLFSREFSNVVFVCVESKTPVVSILDRSTLSFKRAHCSASLSLMPGAGFVYSVSAVSRMFLVRSKEQVMTKFQPSNKDNTDDASSSYFSFKVVEGTEVMW